MGDSKVRRVGSVLRTVLLLGTAGLIATTCGFVEAADPPHWVGARININCTSQCHVLHQSQGQGLTSSASNVNLCQSCHNPSGLAGDLPINTTDKADPGARGVHHAFDVAAVNSELDTQRPGNTEMDKRVMDGNVVCSTCHDQHDAESTYGGTPRISPAKEVSVTGTGVLSSTGTLTGSLGTWYLIQIVQTGTETTALFRYSKDNRVSWFPSACDPGAPSAVTCKEANGGTPVPLDEPVDEGVAVTFSAGTYNDDDEWEFSASWPFLRAVLDSGDNTAGDKFCRDCHRTWVMETSTVRTGASTVIKSHPVGIAYPSAQPDYHANPLDGNGAEQGSGGADTNASNDLALEGASNLVQCLTCHGVHYADSNTLTEDGP